MSTKGQDPAHVITRELLQGDAIQRMVAEGAPNLRILTDAERAASLDATLALRPPGRAGVWLFAYGSLIWNPAIRIAGQRRARIHGWHRAFCLSTEAGRGTQANPGLVLGLDRGGACTGLGLHVAEADIAQELPLLWRREMLSGAYQPRWATLRGLDGAPFARAIAFTIRRTAPVYTGLLAEAETVHRLATAAGALGTAADYLFQTCDSLRRHDIFDPRMERLARLVRAARSLAAPAAPE